MAAPFGPWLAALIADKVERKVLIACAAGTLAIAGLMFSQVAAAAALISAGTRIARHRVVVAVPYETTAAALFGHVRTIGAHQLDRLGAGSGWDYQVHEYRGGWLVLDRPLYQDGPPSGAPFRHFHAYHAGRRASVSADGEVLAGGLDPRALQFVRKWAVLRRGEITANWERARRNGPLLGIDPLA